MLLPPASTIDFEGDGMVILFGALDLSPQKKKRMVGLFDCFEIERKSRNAQKFINDVGVFDARILIFAMNHLLLGVNFAHSTLLYLELFFVADMRSSCVRPTS